MKITVENHQLKVKEILEAANIIPVVAIKEAGDATDIAKSFLDNGTKNIEVLMRNDQAIEAIKNIADNVADIHVGAGTVLAPNQVEQVKQAGGQYVISPGFDIELHEACLKHDIPYIPGAVTASEIQNCYKLGYRYLKFFPAEAMGGVATIKAIGAVFKDIKFCATGGIKAHNVKEYLELNTIIAVGTSSMITDDIQTSKSWDAIERLSFV